MNKLKRVPQLLRLQNYLSTYSIAKTIVQFYRTIVQAPVYAGRGIP